VLARPDSAAYRLRKFARRNRTTVAAVGVTFVALAVATVFSAKLRRAAERQRDAALREVQRQRALGEVQAVLAADSRDANGNALSAAQRIGLAEQVLVQQFSGQPWLVVEGMTALASQLLELGQFASERAMLERAGSLARTANLPAQLAITECGRAWSLIYDDQFDSARTAIAAAREALAQPGAATPQASASCLDAEGQLLVAEGKPDSAVVLLRRAVELTKNVDAPAGNLSTLMDLSQALRAVGRTREATLYQREVVLDREAAGFRGSAIVPDAISNLTAALFELGELATVDSVVRTGMGAQVRIPGGHSSTLLIFLAGLVQLRLGNIDSAEVWLTRAFQRDTSEGAGGLSAYLPPAITQLRLEQGRAAEARQSLADLPSGTTIRRVNRAWFTAWTRYLEGDKRGASAMLGDSLRVIAGAAAKPPPSLAMPLVMLAEWRLAAGDARGADSLAILGRSAAAVDSLALERSAYAGRAELVLARSRKVLGDEPGARVAAERAVVALSHGYGPENRHTRAARAFRDALPE
jgi:tetratricopeptide (TPR) repeat protein